MLGFPHGTESGHGGGLAGPGRSDQTSRERPEVAICSTAIAWSRSAGGPVRAGWPRVTAATVAIAIAGPLTWRPASSRRASASKRVAVV